MIVVLRYVYVIDCVSVADSDYGYVYASDYDYGEDDDGDEHRGQFGSSLRWFAVAMLGGANGAPRGTTSAVACCPQGAAAGGEECRPRSAPGSS